MADRAAGVDAGVALALFLASTSYLVLLPHNLSPADEAVHLYDAKRILDGAVPYRDFFNFITPGFMYVTAGLFRLFGTSIETARGATAALHGLAAALLYLTCRRLDIRPALAWIPALAYLVLCQAAWPIASQHWLSTFFCILLLFLCLGRPSARRFFAIGFVAGLLIAVQQQRGAVMALGLSAWLVVDHFVVLRYRSVRFSALAISLSWLTAGALAVVAPLCVFLIRAAGAEKVWADLVEVPLFTYGPTLHTYWGSIGPSLDWQASFTFPRILEFLPAILPVPAVRLVWLLVRRREEMDARRLALLIVFSTASIFSIAYYPDFIHIAFIAPALLVTCGESLGWLARRSEAAAPRVVRAAGWVTGIVLLVAIGARLYRNLERLREQYPYNRVTAFGRIDMATAREGELYDALDELLRTAPSRSLYCYPIISHLYLMLDAENPTPYGFFFTAYNGPDQARDVLRHLTENPPPYIVFLPPFVAADDPVAVWIRDRYEPIADKGEVGKLIYQPK